MKKLKDLSQNIIEYVFQHDQTLHAMLNTTKYVTVSIL